MQHPFESAWQKALRLGWLPVVLVLGLVARFWVSTYGSNYDWDSWKITADLMARGQDIYNGTVRYNYAPVWMWLLHTLDVLAGHNEAAFRHLLIGCLSAVDIGISWILWRKFGRLAATLYFLNPVSIMLTGYHNQFENVAILMGLWAVILFGDDVDQPVNRRKFCGLAMLGLSLMTKHILFAFPFWLAVKQKGAGQKVIVLLVPVAIFLLSFAPYWPTGHAGIVAHVFQYQSYPNAYFYRLLMPTLVQSTLDPKIVWFLILAWFAFLCRRRSALDSLLMYTCVMLAATPATTNEYLAIPLIFTCVVVNAFTVSYMVIATCHIAAGGDGPPLMATSTGGIIDLAIYCLCLAAVWAIWRDQLLNLLEKCRDEIRHQFGRPG